MEQGKALVKLARKSIGYALASGRAMRELCNDKALLEPRGIFVTLHSFPEKALRGCVGMPYPVKPLWDSVSEMAVEAALNDPRFPPVGAGELEGIAIEISVLTKPEELLCEAKKRPKFVSAGKDGIIVQRGGHSGLFLPQVATEQGWDAEEFLGQCCAKAGLMETMWRSKETHVFRFQAQIFGETAPEGKVEEKKD